MVGFLDPPFFFSRKRGRAILQREYQKAQNGPFSGAAAEKDVASEARSAPVPGGPKTAKTFCFLVFLNHEQHPGAARAVFLGAAIRAPNCGKPLARLRSTFSKTVLFTTLRVASAAKTNQFWAFSSEPEAISHFGQTRMFRPSSRHNNFARKKQCSVCWKFDCLNFNNFQIYISFQESQRFGSSFPICESDFVFSTN